MSKEAFYFSHDYNARTDDKIKHLIRNHGMLGYGVFWSIVEDLYNNANALHLDYDGIAFDLRVDVKVVKSIINDFNLFSIETEIFGSCSVERRLEERNKKSETARQTAFKRWNKDKNDAKALPMQCKGNAIKDIKGKEIKVKEEPNKSATKEKDFIDQVVNCFVEEYGDYKIINPGKERAAAAKILGQYKKQYPNDSSEETLYGLKIFFNQCVNITDNWLYDNMSLSIIVSKFNEIIKILKNGKKGKQKGATPNEIANTIAKNFAIDYREYHEEYGEN